MLLLWEAIPAAFFSLLNNVWCELGLACLAVVTQEAFEHLPRLSRYLKPQLLRLMGSPRQDEHHSLALNYQLQLQAPLCEAVTQESLSSSSQETELENTGAPVEPSPTGLYEADKDRRSGDTSCTVSGDAGSEGELETVVNGLSTQSPGSLWKQPVQQSAKKSPPRQAEGEDSRNQRNGVRGLKIRFSLGPKLTIKKQDRPAEAPSSLLASDRGLSSAPKEDPAQQPWNYAENDVQDSIKKDWQDGDSSCTDTDEDGELIQRVCS